MNETAYQHKVSEAIPPKLRNRTTIKSKTKTRYPMSAEREMKRIMLAYMKILNQELKKELPDLMKEYRVLNRGDSRFDSLFDLRNKTIGTMNRVLSKVEQQVEKFGLRKRLGKIADAVKSSSFREWSRSVKNTLGIDLDVDYYNESFYETMLRSWIDDNVGMITTIPSETLDKMRDIIFDGYVNKKPMSQIEREIQKAYNVSKSRAKMLARDQVSTLSSQVNKYHQVDAGCEFYIWTTARDSRVRESHAALDGTKQRWSNPPEMWYRTKHGIVHTGRHCHPGEDYYCRCTAKPVFNAKRMNIPILGADKNV